VRYAVFDLGSTSFQLLVTDVGSDGSLTHILRDRVILNLGADVAATGHVPQEQADRALQVVARFRDVALRAGADELLPVATAAFRDAANLPWLAKSLRGAIGVPVRILAGEQEIRSTVAGIRASVALPPGMPWLAFDLGGGSLEIALVDGDDILWTDTFPLGAARLTRTLGGRDPVGNTTRREIRRLTRSMLEPARKALGDQVPTDPICVAAGGTAGAMAKLRISERWPEPPASLNQYELRTEDLVDLSKTLCALPTAERLDLPGIDERRVDILPAGAVVLATGFGIFGATRALHSEWGLREGVVLLERGEPPPPTPSELRAASIERLAATWEGDAAHPVAVRRIAEQLFDETAELHGLENDKRALLGSAALVHDVGTQISPNKHHRHSAYLVEHAGLRGFDPWEVAMMASIVRFHRGSGPKMSFPPYAALSATDRAACQILIGLLRIAHGLGRGNEDDVRDVRVTVTKRELEIHVRGDRPEGAVIDAEEHANVLGRTLGCTVRFEEEPSGAPNLG
jgi:exopolyphosphatase / guanosine-5'-triphosphate,3'-diphosphate pyrophosphatase